MTLSGSAGVLSYNGGVGDWNINVSTGLGSDILGLATLDLNSVNSTQGTTSTLDISFTQVDNVFPVGGFAMEFGGTATNVGAISYSAYADQGITRFRRRACPGSVVRRQPRSHRERKRSEVGDRRNQQLRRQRATASTSPNFDCSSDSPI